MPRYKSIKHTPLTQEEIKAKYEDALDEMKEVLEWKKEEEDKLKEDKFKTHQAKSACKRNLVKTNKRVNSVKGTIEYWKNRVSGMSHFKASIILHEYWESLKNLSSKNSLK